MQFRINQFAIIILLAGLASGLTTSARAVDVRAGLSAQETYVGLPITLQIQVSDAEKSEPPTIPAVDGLEIKSAGPPSRNTQISSINGRTTTSSSLTYVFQVTPQRSGNFRIPPIKIHANGADQQTRAMSLVAAKSETDDLLFVEITGKEKQIYVGQALDVRLQIWLRPYRDREHNMTLSDAEMWRLVSDRSTWGLFAERMQQLADNNQRPVGKEVLRKDRSGTDHSYYLYEIAATIYPKRPGKIDAGDTKIVVHYPTAIGKARDPFAGFFDDMQIPGGQSSLFGDDSILSPFGSRLAVKAVRPIVAETAVPSIEVLPIPTTDRPADYRGAVGKYVIATSANPTSVKAGDPIELSIGIAGNGPMDLVQAPPLAELPQLAADFKVPSEPLAGFVKDSRKLFSTTIRPRRSGITQIPPIPFSFFDPAAAKFVTVHSEPISIHVDPADTLALDAIVGNESGTTPADRSANMGGKPTAAAAPTIFMGDDLLQSNRPHAPSTPFLAVSLVVPPLIVFCLFVARLRESSAQWLLGFGSNLRSSKRRIESAERATEVAAALRSSLIRQLRLNVSSDNVTVVGALRSSGHRQLAIRYERMFDACAQDSIAGGQGPQALNELKHSAERILDDLLTERQPKRPKPTPARRTAVKAAAIMAMFTFAATGIVQNATAANASPEVAQQPAPVVPLADEPLSPAASKIFSLTSVQQKVLLSEAADCYNQGVSAAPSDPAGAKQSFARAAEKYQLLVKSGIANSRLDTNLANAYLASGQVETAIANYRKAVEIDRTNRVARTNLAIAERLARPPTTSLPNQQATNSLSFWQSMAAWVGSYLSPLQTQSVMLLAWLAVWVAVAMRVLGYRFPWKTATTASLFLFAVTAALVAAG